MAVDAFHAGGDVRGGSGVIVLPCGAGKTIVGIAALAAAAEDHAGPDHQHHRRRAVAAARSSTRPTSTERPGRRATPASPRRSRPVTLATYQIVTYRPEKDERLPPLQALQRARLGPDHLRRGPPAARPGLPGHGRDPGPPPARPDRDPGPRGRPRGGRLQPDRPEEVRRALARAGDRRAGSPRRSARGPRRPARPTCGWSTPSPSGATSTASPARTRPRTTSSRGCWTHDARRPGADHRPVPQAAAADRRAVRHAADHRRRRRTPSARTCTASSAAARSAAWSSRRSATSPSTCPTPT